MREKATLSDRFWPKVEKVPGGCWIWMANHLPKGYGMIFLRREGRKNVVGYAHRVAYEMAFGPVPDGLSVLHRCDNPPCVKTEPDERFPGGHLFVGTISDNTQDMLAKGRGFTPACAGELHGHAKMTRAQVEEAKARHAAGGISYCALGREYGVSDVAIRRAILGIGWKTERRLTRTQS